MQTTFGSENSGLFVAGSSTNTSNAAPATATQINWSPYLAGAGIGILSWIVFVVVNNPIGVTTALSQISGGVASIVRLVGGAARPGSSARMSRLPVNDQLPNRFTTLLAAPAVTVNAGVARLARLSREDAVVLLFCGSKKSLASGVPMAGALFDPAHVGTVVLPLMIFHQMQLMVCAWLARRYGARPDAAGREEH